MIRALGAILSSATMIVAAYFIGRSDGRWSVQETLTEVSSRNFKMVCEKGCMEKLDRICPSWVEDFIGKPK